MVLTKQDLTPQQWVQSELLNGRYSVTDYLPVIEQVDVYAPANIALCKYWGKRDKLFNLPVTGSLSVSLAEKGTRTQLKIIDAVHHDIWLNGKSLDPQSVFYQKLSSWLGLFLPASMALQVRTTNTVPTAAGLASSASGFAAMAMACNELFGWKLPLMELSALARLGSGSASRSLWHGFVQWQAGELANGSDSIAQPIPTQWSNLRVGLLIVDKAVKSVSSRQGMQRTLDTSLLYQQWPQQVAQDMPIIAQAIADNDFAILGQVSEQNAMAMHATMIASSPPLLYWQTESIHAMHKVWQLRKDGIEVYFTMDAGPNLKLLFESHSQSVVKAAFPALEVVEPFSASLA